METAASNRRGTSRRAAASLPWGTSIATTAWIWPWPTNSRWMQSGCLSTTRHDNPAVGAFRSAAPVVPGLEATCLQSRKSATAAIHSGRRPRASLRGQIEEEDFAAILRADRQLIHFFDPHSVARLERCAVHLRRAAGQVQPPQPTFLEMVGHRLAALKQ